MRPLGNHIVVKPSKAAASHGSIILPASAQKRPACGVVISVGPDVEDVKASQKVWYGEYAGHEIEDWLVITEEDVFGIEEK